MSLQKELERTKSRLECLDQLLEHRPKVSSDEFLDHLRTRKRLRLKIEELKRKIVYFRSL